MPSAADFIPPKSREKIYAWIIELSSPETREAALLELSKKREVAIVLLAIKELGPSYNE